MKQQVALEPISRDTACQKGATHTARVRRLWVHPGPTHLAILFRVTNYGRSDRADERADHFNSGERETGLICLNALHPFRPLTQTFALGRYDSIDIPANPMITIASDADFDLRG